MQKIVEEVQRRGGAARRKDLPGTHTQLAQAVAEGLLVNPARGTYALPGASREQVAAVRADAALGFTSAAKAHGWSLLREPDVIHLTVPRGRPVSRALPGCRYSYRDLSVAERADRLTQPLTTVLDCARRLPFAEGLAIADSALRTETVGYEELQLAAGRLRGQGCAMARRVAEAADGRAANAFESAARAIGLGVRGLDLHPQVVLVGESEEFEARPDLVDPHLGLVIECDSFQYHGGREEFRRDRQRYTRLLLRGWVVMSLVWEDVALFPEETHDRLAAWVEQQQRDFPCGRPGPWPTSIAVAEPAA